MFYNKIFIRLLIITIIFFNLFFSYIGGADELDLKFTTSRLALLFLYIDSGCYLTPNALTKVLEILNINFDVYQRMMEEIKQQHYVVFQEFVFKYNIGEDQIKNLFNYIISDNEVNRIVDYKSFISEYKHFMNVEKIYSDYYKEEVEKGRYNSMIYGVALGLFGYGIKLGGDDKL